MTEQATIAPDVQSFLVGETLFLRQLEAEDAQYPAAWHFSPYAINPQRAETFLKEDLAKEVEGRQHRLVACRRADGVPVAAVRYDNLWSNLTVYVALHVDPLRRVETAAIKAEILAIILPWLWRDEHNMVVVVELDAPEPELIAAAEALGFRPAVRLREAIWRDGARHDKWVYEFLHPDWVAKLGDPGPSISYATEPPATAPGSRRVSIWTPGAKVPRNAVMVSERLALRPMEADDWIETARLLRRETETWYERGRWFPTAAVAAHFVTESMKKDPPSWVNLAVVLRETDTVIGEVSIFGIDRFHRTGETGSILYRPEHRSQGFGSEAKNLLLEYGFDHLGLHMIRSHVWGRNTRSKAALLKQGYRPAGGFRWETTAGAEFVDSLAFDLLASEWRERVGPPVG